MKIEREYTARIDYEIYKNNLTLIAYTRITVNITDWQELLPKITAKVDKILSDEDSEGKKIVIRRIEAFPTP